MPVSAPPPAPLSYGRAARPRTWRTVRRVLILAFAAASVWYAGPTVWRKWTTLNAERRAGRYTPRDSTRWIDVPFVGPGGTTPDAHRAANAARMQWSASDSILFLHTLRRPDGRERLVAIRLGTRRADATDAVVEVRIPAGVLTATRVTTYEVIQYAASTDQFREGLIDSGDPTHFTVEIRDDDGLRRTLDGWLGNDDRVRLIVR